MSALLELEGLSVRIRRRGRSATVLHALRLHVEAGETVGLVGESGSGKSMLGLALMGLLPGAAEASGAIRFDGHDLQAASEAQRRAVRGRDIAMVFQEPMRALNPVQPIGRQVAEGMRLHLRLSRGEAEARTRTLLDRVGLPTRRFPPEQPPHRLSGGQRQRVMIAIAVACRPRLLIADEISTALDATTQAQILAMLATLAREDGMATLSITHDLGVVERICSRTLVLYAGHLVETAPTASLFARPLHPYAYGLLAASLHGARPAPGSMLETIPGQVPDLWSPGEGCCFAGRCPRVRPDCLPAQPPLVRHASGREVACLHPLEPA